MSARERRKQPQRVRAHRRKVGLTATEPTPRDCERRSSVADVGAILASQGAAPTPEAVGVYQAHKLGRLEGQTVVAELMPLPSRNACEWIYSAVAGVPGLLTREAYVEGFGQDLKAPGS